MSQNFNVLFKEIKKIIEDNNSFLILTHDYPDGDSLGSQIALFELLKNIQKNTGMICNSEIPYQYLFLPNIEKITRSFDKAGVNCTDGRCIFFCLDSADESRLNISVEEIRRKTFKIINIDHHIGNTGYGDINVLDFQRSATGEILYEFIAKEYPENMNYNIALGLYTAILTDTGRFQYENTSSSVHRIVSRLLEFGVVPSEVFSNIYENEPFNRFRLLGIVLKRIKVIDSKKLVYSYVLQEDFKSLDLPFSANDGVIEILRSASSAKIAALFKQIGNNVFKVSLRSTNSDYNVAEIAAKFGGGGHKMASAYSGKGNLKEIIKNLVDAIKY